MPFATRVFAAALLLAFVPVHAFAACYPPPAGIVGWWPLDESAPGPALDRVYANNGWVNFGAGITPSQQVMGEVDGGYRFLNSDQLIVMVPVTGKYDFGSRSLTIDAWIQPIEHSAIFHYLQPIVDCHVLNNSALGYEAGHAGWAFYLKEGQLAFMMAESNGSMSHYYSQTAPVVLNEWQHVAVTIERDGTHANLGTFYYNGQPVGTFAPSSASLSVTPYGLRIGGGPATIIGKPSCGNT